MTDRKCLVDDFTFRSSTLFSWIRFIFLWSSSFCWWM